MASDFERQLLYGMAQLVAADVTGITWKAPGAGAYTATQAGIYLDSTPETAVRAVQLSLYPVDDDPVHAASIIGFQTIVRWEGSDPLPTRDLDSAIFDALHGRTHFTLSTGITVASCARRSGASLGQDASRRWSRSSNYYLQVTRPAPHRL